MYKGSYSIELHARTNAIGMPIKISNFFQNGFNQNNSDFGNVFDSRYWENIRSKIKISSAFNVKFIFYTFFKLKIYYQQNIYDTTF